MEEKEKKSRTKGTGKASVQLFASNSRKKVCLRKGDFSKTGGGVIWRKCGVHRVGGVACSGEWGVWRKRVGIISRPGRGRGWCQTIGTDWREGGKILVS